MMQALLVVDVQNEYSPGKLPVAYPGVFGELPIATDQADVSRSPVAVVRHTSLSGPVTFRKGTPEWELCHKIKSRPNDILVEKDPQESCAGSSLQ